MGYIDFPASVAQWIARPPPKGQVAGSIPARGTSEIKGLQTDLKIQSNLEARWKPR